jgi:Domain of Unknown Function (DUF748)
MARAHSFVEKREAAAATTPVEWRELFHRALVGEIELDRPKLNFVKGPTSETSQTRVDSSWQDRVKELFPLRINRLTIEHGEAHYRDFYSKPPVDVLVNDLHVVARNLTNSRGLSKTMAASIDADGRPLGANLTMHVDVDPYQPKPTFDAAAELTHVDLTKFQDFAKAYGGFDFQSGWLSIYTELAAAKGKFTGYVKPLITDLQIPDWNEEPDNFLQRVWGVIVGVTAKVFRNHPKDRFATRVDLAGSFDDPNYSMWEIVGQVLKNTFVKAIPPRLEGNVSLGEAEKQNGVNVEEAHGSEAERRNTAAEVVKKRVAEKKRKGEAAGPDESNDRSNERSAAKENSSSENDEPSHQKPPPPGTLGAE